MIKMELIPLIGIGPFLFDSLISIYNDYPIIEVPEEYDDKTGWKSYKLENMGIWIYGENGKIISIACYDECIYKGVNLIGLEIGILKCIINSNLTDYESIELDDGIKEILEYNELGIQIYIKGGFVESVTCSSNE